MRPTEREKGMYGDTHRGVMMEAAPHMTFKMIEAYLLFHILVVALYTPTKLGGSNKLLQ